MMTHSRLVAGKSKEHRFCLCVLFVSGLLEQPAVPKALRWTTQKPPCSCTGRTITVEAHVLGRQRGCVASLHSNLCVDSNVRRAPLHANHSLVAAVVLTLSSAQSRRQPRLPKNDLALP